jgi:lipase (class 3)
MSLPNAPQTMLWLAFAADADAQNQYVKDCSTATQLYGLIGQRLDTLRTETGQSWTVVWGPAIYSFPINYKGRHVDNAIYVVKNTASNDYAIAVAGTDAYSLADWIFEDFLVATTVPWLLEIGYQPRPRISLATFNGLTILLNIAPPCTPLPGAGQQLVKFLGSITKNGPINLYTTGHSLGGALAPSLTLALDDLRLLWDLRRNATFLPYAFAGPTPGDAAFAGYFQQKFPGGLQRIWNSLDIVPHAWDTPHMQELPGLYGPPIPAVTEIVNEILGTIGATGYTPLNAEGPTFTGTQQNPNITTIQAYLTEAVYQHVNAYAIWAGVQNWSTPKITM